MTRFKILLSILILCSMGLFFILSSNNYFDFDNHQLKLDPQVKGESTQIIDESNQSINLSTPQSANPPVNQSTLQTYSLENTRDGSGQANQQINQVPILMYHYIRDYNDPNDQIGTNLSVSPKQFDNQLNWLKNHNYQTVDFESLDRPNAISTKPVILTFDDGYEDAYTNAFPILKRYDFTATFYIITNYVDKNNYMTWNQIIALKNVGMNIGSHTLSHPDLSKASLERVEKEISQSKKILEEKIGVTISDFCYPSGKYNENTINLLKKYDYKTATTTKSGIYDSIKNNIWEVARYRITNQTDLGKILQ